GAGERAEAADGAALVDERAQLGVGHPAGLGDDVARLEARGEADRRGVLDLLRSTIRRPLAEGRALVRGPEVRLPVVPLAGRRGMADTLVVQVAELDVHADRLVRALRDRREVVAQVRRALTVTDPRDEVLGDVSRVVDRVGELALAEGGAGSADTGEVQHALGVVSAQPLEDRDGLVEALDGGGEDAVALDHRA